MKYGYARVSTLKQSQGNSLESQSEQLREAGAVKIFADVITGTTTNREQLDKLLALLEEGDTIIVTKLDRLARSLSQGADLIDQLIERGVTVYIVNIGVSLNNQASSILIRNIFLSFAQFERDMIIERTTEGRAVARTKPGYKDGRHYKYTRQQLDHALGLLDNYSYRQVANMTGISKSTLIRAKNRRAAANEK